MCQIYFLLIAVTTDELRWTWLAASILYAILNFVARYLKNIEFLTHSLLNIGIAAIIAEYLYGSETTVLLWLYTPPLISGVILNSVRSVYAYALLGIILSVSFLSRIDHLLTTSGIFLFSSLFTHLLLHKIDVVYSNLIELEREKKAKAQLHNEHLQKELERLIFPHQKALIVAGNELEETMAVGHEMGNIGELDIVNSSSIATSNSETYQAQKAEFFGRCYEILLEKYRIDSDTPLQPVANGYPFKEDGDGFKFTIGYPFRSESHPEYVALTLARQFTDVFDNTVGSISLGRTFCAIVLSRLELRTYWVKKPTLKFEIMQHCVSRIVRLGELRRVLSKDNLIPVGNIVLMDDEFFNQVSAIYEWETPPGEINLKANDLKVRDHSIIQSVYWIRVNDIHLRPKGKPRRIRLTRVG